MTFARSTTHPPAVRALTAAALTQGDLVSVSLNGAHYPARVLSNRHDADKAHLVFERLDSTVALYEATWPAASPVLTLPRHHGVCAHCGQIAPCRDEMNERVLEILWAASPSDALVDDLHPTP